MKILTISGSSRIQSANIQLLDSLSMIFPDKTFHRYAELDQLPLFKAESDKHPWPKEVLDWRTAIAQSTALIISTPEYIHNLPALIKNALEWVTSSGELAQKPTVAITFTPHPPRGEKAMQSLLWSLQALEASVLVQLPLYQQEIKFDSNGNILESEGLAMLREAINLLES